MKKHPLLALVFLALVALAAALFFLERPLATRGPGPPPDTGARPEIEFRGTVEAGGAPVARARVELFEDAPRGLVRSVEAGSDGAFRIEWLPTATDREDRVYLAAEDPAGRFARTVQRAEHGARIELRRKTAVPGRVIDMAGRPVAGAVVQAVAHHDTRSHAAVTDAAGEFLLDALPEDAPLHVLACTIGYQPLVESRFRSGDFLTLRLDAARPVALEVRGPDGAPVEATARLVVPRALAEFAPRGAAGEDGRLVVPDASSGGSALVEVEAPGHLPVQLAASPHVPRAVILWPARNVSVTVFDPRRQSGIEGVDFEVEIAPEGGAAAWQGDTLDAISRPFPVRHAAQAGEYVLRLPRCRVRLTCTARGYDEAELMVAAGAERTSVRLPPLRDAPAATLVFRTGVSNAEIPLVVVDEEGGWYRSFALVDGEAEVEVPPGRTLHFASLQAADALWAPKQEVPALRAGERRILAVQLRKALRLEVRVEPPVDGEVSLVDVAQEKLGDPQRAPLREGVARFWVRPLRALRAHVTPVGNYYEREGEFAVEQEDRTWTARLRSGAGARYVVRDRPGHPIPFARARLWEPTAQGRAELRAEPRVFRTDATGTLLMQGLRPGLAALEVSAPGFRAQRFAGVRLEEEEVAERGGLVLDLAEPVRGRVVDPDGAPVAGAWVHVLHPHVARISAGPVELDAYDLGSGDVATDAEGRFEVLDDAPTSPVLGVRPAGRPDLAPGVFDLGAEEYRLERIAYATLDVPGTVEGVYRLLPGGRAVRIKDDPAISLRPLPIVVPGGHVELLILLRDGRYAAPILDLEPGETAEIRPEFRR